MKIVLEINFLTHLDDDEDEEGQEDSKDSKK